MAGKPLDYAQSTHPAEEAARHIPDYEAGRPRGVPNSLIWLILFLCVVAYCGIGNWVSRSGTTAPPATLPHP